MASSEQDEQNVTIQKSEPQNISPSELSTQRPNIDEPAASTPLEMSTLESAKTPPPTTAASPSVPQATVSNTSVANSLNSPNNESASPVSPLNSREQQQADTSPTNPSPAPMTRQLSTAIGPSSDQPMPVPKEAERSGPTLMVTLLLTSGARHPFKLDSKYLQKRNVKVTGDDPFNISVYTLKELILREWRDGWFKQKIVSYTLANDRSRMGNKAVKPWRNTIDIVWKAIGR
ncbi:MAG: hypothetical protein Q9160_006718 [Pyrenula sp. 1 TL-2023]